MKGHLSCRDIFHGILSSHLKTGFTVLRCPLKTGFTVLRCPLKIGFTVLVFNHFRVLLLLYYLYIHVWALFQIQLWIPGLRVIKILIYMCFTHLNVCVFLFRFQVYLSLYVRWWPICVFISFLEFTPHCMCFYFVLEFTPHCISTGGLYVFLFRFRVYPSLYVFLFRFRVYPSLYIHRLPICVFLLFLSLPLIVCVFISFQSLPLIVCPPVAVDKVIVLEPEAFDIPLGDESDIVRVSPPCAHSGPGPVYTRLLSFHMREGQVMTIKAKMMCFFRQRTNFRQKNQFFVKEQLLSHLASVIHF